MDEHKPSYNSGLLWRSVGQSNTRQRSIGGIFGFLLFTLFAVILADMIFDFADFRDMLGIH